MAQDQAVLNQLAQLRQAQKAFKAAPSQNTFHTLFHLQQKLCVLQGNLTKE